MRARQVARPFVLCAALTVMLGAALAQPPMRQARPAAGGTEAGAALEASKPPVGPTVEPGTLDPAAGAAGQVVPESGESRATESAPARAARAPKMAHTGTNLVALYALSALAVGAGVALWAASRRQLRTSF